MDSPIVIEVNVGGPQGVPGPSGLNAGEITTASYVSNHPGTLTKGMAVCLVNGMLRRASSAAGFQKAIGFVYEAAHTHLEAVLQGRYS